MKSVKDGGWHLLVLLSWAILSKNASARKVKDRFDYELLARTPIRFGRGFNSENPYFINPFTDIYKKFTKLDAFK